MFRSNILTLFACVACFAISQAAYVDTIPKCDYKDIECLKKEIQSILSDIAKTGIPEYGIPPIDPLDVKNLKLNLLDIVNVNIIEGTVKGIKNCEVNDLKVNMEKGKTTIKLICDITAKGKYDISGSNPALKELIGGSSVHGNGNAKLKIEKVMIKFDFKFDVVKRDGELYIDCHKDLAKYEFELLGDSKIQLDKLFVGDVESSQLLVNYYNENAKTLWKSFGKSIMDTVFEMAYELIHKFFGVVPVKYYLAGDLSPYVKQ